MTSQYILKCLIAVLSLALCVIFSLEEIDVSVRQSEGGEQALGHELQIPQTSTMMTQVRAISNVSRSDKTPPRLEATQFNVTKRTITGILTTHVSATHQIISNNATDPIEALVPRVHKVAISNTQSLDAKKNSKEGIDCKWTDPNNVHPCVTCLLNRLKKPKDIALRTAFFGDSTMGRLWRQVYNKMNVPVDPISPGDGKTNTTVLMESLPICKDDKITVDRCNTFNALNLTLGNSWIQPRPTLEGPVSFGLHNPGCSDCSSCFSHIYRNSRCPLPHRFGITFARDVTWQTSTTPTTQETMARILQERLGTELQLPLLCIVNTGLHDMNIASITDETYIQNVKFYFETTLQQPKHCWHILWISTTSTLDNRKRPQRNEKIRRWNQLVQEMIERYSFQATILDIFEISSNWSHVDNVHLTQDFYEKGATLITALLQNLK